MGVWGRLNEGLARTDADATGQDNPSMDRHWLEGELSACGIPAFGLDRWLKDFMEDALAAGMTDEKLLNFLCLARDKALGDDQDFVAILNRTEHVLFSRMPGNEASAQGDIERTGYDPGEHADAMQALCAGTLTNRQLVELFDLSATLRADTDVGHMWRAIMYLSRVHILQRMKRARPTPPPSTFDSNGGHVDDHISTRQALRIAEEAFRPDMSDAQLLELYVLVEEYSNPDEGAFDDIANAVSEMVFDRLRRGYPDPQWERYAPGFDFPDAGKEALEAVLKGDLPHKNLLMLYRLCWDRERADPVWLAVHDLCRGQLLDRMSGPQIRVNEDWWDGRFRQLTQRVKAYV